MNLNKNICKHCMTSSLKNSQSCWNWTRNDERRWNDKKVFCPVFGVVDTNTKPNSRCKFKLEHMVLTQKKTI